MTWLVYVCTTIHPKCGLPKTMHYGTVEPTFLIIIFSHYLNFEFQHISVVPHVPSCHNLFSHDLSTFVAKFVINFHTFSVNISTIEKQNSKLVHIVDVDVQMDL